MSTLKNKASQVSHDCPTIEKEANSEEESPVANIFQAAEKQLFNLVEWAKRIPHFTKLSLDDQVTLLRAGWNELLIAGFSHRSIPVKDGILLASGIHVHRSSAHYAGVGTIFDRVLSELVAKMREMKMDKSELGCLRAIVLFNPDAKGLVSTQEVESLREKVYATLEEYCKCQYPEETGRFAKLLLLLVTVVHTYLLCPAQPSLSSIICPFGCLYLSTFFSMNDWKMYRQRFLTPPPSSWVYYFCIQFYFLYRPPPSPRAGAAD
ncbi:RXRA [Acanthosepion pharaonis]|uniref:RXRA n=1 Tax=Acanthosepion pharaonis TaxID=158019 RepID=A0A812D7A0_ACAPH|nr:RXRA [Sepia pharaonis]